MTPEDFSTDLSRRLRCRGVECDLADLNALTAEALELVGEPDIESLTDRFVKASRTYAVEFHKSREARNAMICGAAILAAGLAACVAYCNINFVLWPSAELTVFLLLFGTVMSGVVTTVWGGLLLALSCCRSWRAKSWRPGRQVLSRTARQPP